MDADVNIFPRLEVPAPERGREDEVWTIGKFRFRSNFDSGNLALVQQGSSANVGSSALFHGNLTGAAVRLLQQCAFSVN